MKLTLKHAFILLGTFQSPILLMATEGDKILAGLLTLVSSLKLP